jgi:sulfur transfer protein SufE
MNYSNKIIEYKNNVETLRAIESLEVYRWLTSLGKKLDNDPLSEEKRTEENRVSRCQFDLFVDWEDGRFKAWSNAIVAGGYAYILVDIFNCEGAEKITIEEFEEIKLDELLTMNRKTGFYQMIEMMIKRIPNVKN